MENNKVIRGAFRIAARGRREGGGSPVHEKLRGGLKCGQPLEPPPSPPPRGTVGGEGNAERVPTILRTIVHAPSASKEF